MSQNARLISYLSAHGSITQLEAFNALGICRLSERIRELDRLGWGFRHEPRVKVPSRTGYAYVTRYHLITEPTGQGASPARVVPLSTHAPTYLTETT